MTTDAREIVERLRKPSGIDLHCPSGLFRYAADTIESLAAERDRLERERDDTSEALRRVSEALARADHRVAELEAELDQCAKDAEGRPLPIGPTTLCDLVMFTVVNRRVRTVWQFENTDLGIRGVVDGTSADGYSLTRPISMCYRTQEAAGAAAGEGAGDDPATCDCGANPAGCCDGADCSVWRSAAKEPRDD